MPCARRHTLSKTGFTLLELSIVLMVIAAIIAGTVSMGSSMIQSAQLVNTNNKLDAIETALMNYRLVYNRLPCPTDPTLTDVAGNATTYGVETGTPGTCTAASIISYTYPTGATNTNYNAAGVTVAEGAIPVRTLGLPDEFQFDGWGRKFAYAVAAPMTSKATATAYPAFISYGAQANCGAIKVENAFHSNRSPVADYALLSYGPDGHGGYTKAGTRYNAGVNNADELTNCHCTNAAVDTGNYAASYVQKDMSMDGSDAVNPFQHILRYKERWQMQNAYDGYHPQSYMPCTTGFIVQGSVANMFLGLKQAKIPRPAAFRSHIFDGAPSPFCSMRSSRIGPISTFASPTLFSANLLLTP